MISTSRNSILLRVKCSRNSSQN